MSEMVSVSAAKGQLGALVDRARLQHETVFLSRRGKRVVALVDADEYERLRELAEDAEDAAEAVRVRREMLEANETPIPWDDVKAELGLA